ncbi:MAG: dTDP-4-dehydrorhamnose reductase [Flavobacteriaceae bacterium]|nr:dTDP-4-dehydrorhamnose reductase [Flavobacteriaceae bacterium]
MKTVLVTGASGQLGKCFQKLAAREVEIDWLFMDSSEIDITSTKDLRDFFKSKRIDYCINCAAYTNVEKAESEQEKAFDINAEAVKNLAVICKKNHSVLIHFSTDYVFDGTSKIPYSEKDLTNPINVYGASKLQGENYIRDILTDYFIFRTSWLYSEFGHNFFKTILIKAEEKATLNITIAQTGTPTNANHLAQLVLMLIKEKNTNFGLYHFSNSGETTWYGFANEILKVSGNLKNVQLNKDNSYKTIAARPAYSVLDKTKLLEAFKTRLEPWEDAVRELYKSGIQN